MHWPFLHTWPWRALHSSTSARSAHTASAAFPAWLHPLHPPARALLTHAVVVVRQLEAGEAEAVVGAHRVFAGAVAARLALALVDI